MKHLSTFPVSMNIHQVLFTEKRAQQKCPFVLVIYEHGKGPFLQTDILTRRLIQDLNGRQLKAWPGTATLIK